MTEKERIGEFFMCKSFALAGYSRNQSKFGNVIYKEMNKLGIRIYPLNPHSPEISGVRCYKELFDLPEVPEGLIIAVSSERCGNLLEQAVKSGINYIWFQQGTSSKDAVKFCRERGMNVIDGHCIFMFMEPVQSIHKFHRWLWRLIGKYPK